MLEQVLRCIADTIAVWCMGIEGVTLRQARLLYAVEAAFCSKEHAKKLPKSLVVKTLWAVISGGGLAACLGTALCMRMLLLSCKDHRRGVAN